MDAEDRLGQLCVSRATPVDPCVPLPQHSPGFAGVSRSLARIACLAWTLPDPCQRRMSAAAMPTTRTPPRPVIPGRLKAAPEMPAMGKEWLAYRIKGNKSEKYDGVIRAHTREGAENRTRSSVLQDQDDHEYPERYQQQDNADEGSVENVGVYGLSNAIGVSSYSLNHAEPAGRRSRRDYSWPRKLPPVIPILGETCGALADHPLSTQARP